MDKHYIDRVEKLLGKEHMQKWCALSPDEMYLSRKNYPWITAEPMLIDDWNRRLRRLFQIF